MASAPGILRACIQSVAAVAVVNMFLSEKVADVFRVSGSSMSPTLLEDDKAVLVNRLPVKAKALHVGDIVTLKDPENADQYLCKRIAGMPGNLVVAPSLSVMSPSQQVIRVPPGHVWLLGDSPAQSRDSRVFGPVSQGLLEGRVVAVVWPPKSARFVASHHIEHTHTHGGA